MKQNKNLRLGATVGNSDKDSDRVQNEIKKKTKRIKKLGANLI